MAQDPEIPSVEGAGDGGDDELRRLLAAFSTLGNGLYDTTINGQDAESGIAGLQSNTGIQIINVGHEYRYKDEPRLFADEKGQLTDWRDRFGKPGHVFDPGERVVVPAYVEVNQDGDMSLVADDQDGRMADVFHLSDLDPDVRRTLLENQGLAIGCIVDINGLRQLEMQLSDIHEYDASVENRILIPPINPTPEQLANLPKGYRVIVEGEVVGLGFDKKMHYSSEIQEAYLVVAGQDGQQIKFPTWRRENIKYNGGTIGNVKGKEVTVGERVRVTGYVEQSPSGNTLHGHYSEPYMVEGTPERLEQYTALRESVARRTRRLSEMVDSGDYRSARYLFAQLRSDELLVDEGQQIMAIRYGIPEDERPIYDGHDEGRKYWAGSLDEAYGVMIESMTKTEYIEFVRSVAKGELPEVGKHCDASYAYMIMTDNEYDSGTWVTVLSEALDTRIARLEQVPDEHEVAFPQSYMLEQTLGYLSTVHDHRATEKILDTVRYCMKNKYYDKRQQTQEDWQCPHKFLGLLFKSTDSLVRSTKETPGNLDAIQDLEELVSWRDELLGYPFMDYSVDYLGQVIDMFSVR